MMDIAPPGPFALRARQYQQQRAAFWKAAAEKAARSEVRPSFYQRSLQAVYRAQIPPGKRVLEIGCGAGDLLAGLQPSFGLGVDFSEKWLRLARRRYPRERYPGLHFLCADGLDLPACAPFDFIILADLVNDLWDVQALLESLRRCCHPQTRLLLNFSHPFWASLRQAVGGRAQQNRLGRPDLRNLLALSGFDGIRALPAGRLGPFAQLLEARPRAVPLWPEPLPSVSVIVPARNEAGNIRTLIERIPRMGSAVEVIFVEGNSCDDTRAEIQRQIQAHPEITCRLFCQEGRGKGDAVRLGCQQARGDVLMILDADLTVPPEYLPRFYQALLDGCGDLVNGVRLVYPMEKGAMRRANYLGNRFFSLAFGWLIGQPVKDTLCGTKVLYRSSYQKIAENRAFFGDLDPFGDFDLLFGAARLNLKIVDLPIRYQERTYRSSNIQRWRDGWLLLKMLAAAAFRLKFQQR